MTQNHNIENTQALTILTPQNLTTYNKKVNPLPKYWNRDYINQQIQTIKNHKHKMLLRLLWMTGIRITEAVNIRIKDLDYDNHTATIRWLKNRKYQYRTIPLHPLLKEMLQVYTATLKSEDILFPITRQRAWQLVKKYMKGHPHQFRHSFAVNWLRCGGDIIVLSRMLGHAKIQSTMEYLKIVPVDQGKELLKITF